jgi:pimeloyl-ACP methyl ester carboxylesterase
MGERMSKIFRPRGARRKSLAELAKSKSQAADGNLNPSVSHGYVRSFDGTKLFYSIEGSGKPLIFCYGLVCSSLHWTYQIDHFSQKYRAIWADYRGHQNSETPKDLNSLTLGNIARDMISLLDELGVKDAVFLGHSMGVNVVLEIYRQQPERVAAMVLANGTAKRPLETLMNSNAFEAGFGVLRKIHDRSPKLVQTVWKATKGNPLVRSFMAFGGFNPHLTPAEDIQLYIDQIADMDPSIFIHLIHNYDRYDASSWLHEIKVPTLVIAGENDKVIPLRQQELMQQLIPSSRLEIIRHGSHCPQMDLPDLVNMKIEKFLDEINYGPESTRTKESASQSNRPSQSPLR